jgi:hypothetical protein
MSLYGNGIPLHVTGREKVMDRRKVNLGTTVSSEEEGKEGRNDV